MGAKIDVISRELIKPSSPTPPDSKELKLSLLDQHAPFIFIPLLFFYQKQQHDSKNIVDPSKTAFHLKQSLSETLTKFYLLAGKLNPPDLFTLDCDDSGALFVEAKVDAPLSKAIQNAPYESFVHYLPFEPFVACGDGDDDDKLLLATYPRNEILLAVQISWFECGGNAIGVCISHKVADFASLVTFMNSWAAANRGECTKSFLNKDPNFDLGRLLFPPQFPFSRYTTPPAAEKGKVVFKRFLFNQETLTQLKELATSSSSSSSLVKDPDPTRVEVVTAFLWKQLIKVARAKRNQEATGNGKTFLFRLWHVVNFRSRMSSLAALSDDEDESFPFGNLATVTPASFTTCDDDENQEERNYGDLVWLIRTAIRKVDDDYVLNFAVPFLKSLCASGTTEEEEVVQLPTATMVIMSDLIVSSWCRFPTYEVDFGWGKPISVGPAGNPNHPMVYLTSTSSEEEGIEAWIAMLDDELALLPDEILSLAATDFFHIN